MSDAGGGSATASAVSRYRFVRRLAHGGMAEVFVADAAGAAGVTRRVAVKRILPNLAAEQVFTHMFVNEARVASTLQHPNIVQTYDVIDNAGDFYLVMELLEGVNLLDAQKLLRKQGQRFSAPLALYIVDRVLAGLHYAHQRRTHRGEPLHIVHRDVSPHNIYLTEQGGVKLLDFGVAKAAQVLKQKEGTESGVVKGKVRFMSPEQCQGVELDHRADIWSAGVLLYIMISGVSPFKGKNPYDTMRAIIHDYPASPSSVQHDIPASLDAVVLQALAKKPEHRFATARDMQRAITDVIRQEHWFVTEIEFNAFMEALLATREPIEPDVSDLPLDLVISEGGTEQLHRYTAQSADGGPMAETPHAVIEQVGGLTVLRLRGTIDERFEAEPLIRHLEGVVLIDSEAVTRVTSYGIRGLLWLFQSAATTLAAVYHIRCSVALVQQVGMIRKLLAGGKVVSFHLPYIDPETGSMFTELVSGAEGAAILKSQKAPEVPCPGFPDRMAEFDDDERSYLCFAEDFLEEPPLHIATVIDALVLEERRRAVEKAVSLSGTELWIRRPIDEAYRWNSAMAGVEGALMVDMSATPSWTERGLRALLRALEHDTDHLTNLLVLHSPTPLYQRLSRGVLAEVLDPESTVRVHARCEICQAPRRVAVAPATLAGHKNGDILDGAVCPTCGSSVVCRDDVSWVDELIRATAPTPVPAPSVSPDTAAMLETLAPAVENPAVMFGLIVVAVLVGGLALIGFFALLNLVL